MFKIILTLVLAIPPWVAAQFDAPKWAVMMSVAPLFLFCMMQGDPDQNMFGEASGTVRKWLLMFVLVGGLGLGAVTFILWRVFFPNG